ncbi:MAG: AMP-binding protein [Gemmatimonadaceae bacterium]
MTETSPLGTLSRLTSTLELHDEATQWAYRAKQGRPVPFVELRARNENGIVPWDGTTMGELEVRGAWVAAAYYNTTEGAASFTPDGYFRTGDIVTIDAGLRHHPGPRQGSRQVWWRVDQFRGAGRRVDGVTRMWRKPP